MVAPRMGWGGLHKGIELSGSLGSDVGSMGSAIQISGAYLRLMRK